MAARDRHHLRPAGSRPMDDQLFQSAGVLDTAGAARPGAGGAIRGGTGAPWRQALSRHNLSGTRGTAGELIAVRTGATRAVALFGAGRVERPDAMDGSFGAAGAPGSQDRKSTRLN